MQDEKRRRVRQSAMGVFLRYGYRKVTMSDLARGAGMSRPALYLIFPNKEAVFRDLVQSGLDDLLARVESGLPDHRSLADQLAYVFQVSSVDSFELVARAPAAAELMSASFDFVQDLFDAYDRRRLEILSRLIAAAVTDAHALEPSARARARVMIAATHGFKAEAKSAAAMRALVDDLVRMTVAGLPLRTGGARPRPRARPGDRRGRR
jgi:AcrR family transcriptional regulator